MFRLWGKIMKGNNIKSDQVFELDAKGLSLDDKIDQGLESLCNHFDIQNLCGSMTTIRILVSSVKQDLLTTILLKPLILTT